MAVPSPLSTVLVVAVLVVAVLVVAVPRSKRRSAFGFRGGKHFESAPKATEHAWRSSLDRAPELFLILVEQAIYNKHHDSALRYCVKQSKDD